MEKWKDIPSYEGRYQISSKGRVKSIFARHKVLYLKPHKKGYVGVALSRDGKKNYYFVHRIVAKAFIPNLENKPEVNHKNLDCSDNRIENLEWVTREENINHRVALARLRKNAIKRLCPKCFKLLTDLLCTKDFV